MMEVYLPHAYIDRSKGSILTEYNAEDQWNKISNLQIPPPVSFNWHRGTAKFTFPKWSKYRMKIIILGASLHVVDATLRGPNPQAPSSF